MDITQADWRVIKGVIPADNQLRLWYANNGRWWKFSWLKDGIRSWSRYADCKKQRKDKK